MYLKQWFASYRHTLFLMVKLILTDFDRQINSHLKRISTFSYIFSGVCIAHMFYNRMRNIDVEAITSCFDTLLHIFSMIAYKAFSTTFPYIATLLALELLMKYFYDFSIIDIPSMDHLTCQTSLWRNILYIDQFYPLEERVSDFNFFLSLFFSI